MTRDGDELGQRRIRPALAQDVPRLVTVIRAAYRGPDPGWTSEHALVEGPRTEEEDVARMLLAADGLMLVAERGDSLVGCCHLERLPGGTAGFGMFAVDPARQSSGHGRALLREAERSAARLWRSRRMRLLVLDHRPELLDWYLRCGYEVQAGRVPFRSLAPATEHARVAGLAFLVLEKWL